MMYWLRRFFGFFVSRAFWVLVGVFALSLLIWYAGPLFAFAEHRPLESANVRWWLIVGLFALYVLWLICRRRSKFEPPCRLNIEPGVEADFCGVGCG